jgi:sec-independent protein translocase protein TatA
VISGLESPWHWLILLVIVLVIFGPKRLPELGKQLGSGIRDFRASVAGEDDEDKSAKSLKRDDDDSTV